MRTPARSTPTLPRLRTLAAAAVGATIAATLTPAASYADEPTVTLKVADQPAAEVPVDPRSWPADVLESNNLDVDSNDIVQVHRDGRQVSGERKRVQHGDVVRLIDVEKERKVKQETIKPDVVEVPTTKLKPGQRKVVRKGEPGVRRVIAVKTLHDAEPVNYEVVKRKTVTEPVYRRVLVGQRAYSVPGADALNWGALANCESGGNPRAVNPAGYYGLYQFDVSTWRSVGGSGMPHHASPEEQTYRAKLLYKQRGRSPWPNCGRFL